MAKKQLVPVVLWALVLVSSATLAQTTPTVVPVEQTSYHVPVFRNELVTVLNVYIPPNQTSGYHRHALDSIGVLLADTERTGQVLGAAVTVTPPRPRGSMNFSFYSQQENVHTVTITGNTPFHNIVIEIMYPNAGRFTAATRTEAQRYEQILDNERVRAWRLVLAPGEEAPAFTQSAPGMRIVVDGGEIVENVPGRPERRMAPRSGEFYWQDAGTTRAVRNVGTTRVDLVEFELK